MAMQHMVPRHTARRPSRFSGPESFRARHHHGDIRCRAAQRRAFAGNQQRLGHARRLPWSRATDGGGEDGDLGAAFSEELSRRSNAAAQQQEHEEAENFDGEALLQVIRDRYERSYDVTLVRRSLAGKNFISLNIMWAYREQASFALTEEEHLNRLDYVAEALRAWGQVRAAKESIAGQRSRPRVGKAISVQLAVDDRSIQEWFGS